MKYFRSEIKKHYKTDMIVDPKTIGKYTCQVFNSHDEFVDYIIANTREEVKEIYKSKYEKGE